MITYIILVASGSPQHEESNIKQAVSQFISRCPWPLPVWQLEINKSSISHSAFASSRKLYFAGPASSSMFIRVRGIIYPSDYFYRHKTDSILLTVWNLRYFESPRGLKEEKMVPNRFICLLIIFIMFNGKLK